MSKNFATLKSVKKNHRKGIDYSTLLSPTIATVKQFYKKKNY